ncbi:MAG: flagellar hook-basal body complex protein FliE [Chromatiales bacterium]|jgi:flagellar hook-basal body complex protein FliE|nr:flagellar hook-basal body complex protein FliE [Chromatiales bacterium]
MINESSRAALLAQMQQMAAAANVEPGMAAKPAGDPVEFSSMLKRVVDQVNEVQQGSEQLSKDFVLGDEQVDIAEVMVAMQKARVHFETMLQVRNRLVTAYEEIMRMPV